MTDAANSASIPASGSDSYAAQARGDDDAYASYYAGMDKSMQQKVALTTAFFPPSGILVDMGCGSGSGSFDLASLFSGLRVIGVDIAAQAVEYARAHYQRANLCYQQGDIADPLFAPGSVDGILNSSVWHHLTSFNGFSHREVERALRHHAEALRPGGVLVVRDFVVPRFPTEVWIDLPSDDGTSDGAVTGLSTAALFHRFCAQFRSSQNPAGPVPYQQLPSPQPGWSRFLVAGRAAAEFLLHKDYRSDWDAECREEYTFYSQAEYEAAFRRHGLRIVLSVELHNPWIIENRFRGRCALHQISGEPLPFPPTNYLIVGEKVAPHHGVRLAVDHAPLATPHFLRLHTLRHQKTGQLFQLAERPNPVLDVIPWFRHGGRVLVLAKHGFPRPLSTTLLDGPALDGAHVAGYLTETITAQVRDLPFAHSDKASATILATRAGLPNEAIAAIQSGLGYYTSPGGLSEHVSTRLCELNVSKLPQHSDGFPKFSDEVQNYTPFTTAGRVQPFVAAQLLRAAQVGGLQDARLEISVYHLLLSLGEALGPWIGIELSLSPQTAPGFVPAITADVLATRREPAFANVESSDSAHGFLSLYKATVEELDASDKVLRRAELELCAPRSFGLSTVSVIPVVRLDNQYLVGLERRDLPAVQLHTAGQHSTLLTCPAWRLPKTIQTFPDAEALVLRNLLAHFGVKARRVFPLGGKYYPSIGATPEVVYPLVAEVAAETLASSALAFVPLDELVAQRQHIEDGHLLCAMFRLAHALSITAPSPTT
ncbi:MAG TPA: methyltransferase domain-containing protein [Pseudomonadota bacterium]|nr:methyltransferase domain-containing protein [Pseudomonadota bacterium]